MHCLLQWPNPAALTQTANAVIEGTDAGQNELAGALQLVWRSDDARLTTYVLDHVNDRR